MTDKKCEDCVFYEPDYGHESFFCHLIGHVIDCKDFKGGSMGAVGCFLFTEKDKVLYEQKDIIKNRVARV